MSNNNKTPAIRFKGFTDAWEQRELGECMKTVTDYVAAGSFADIADHVQYKNTPDYAQLIRTVDLKHEFRNNDYIYVDKKAFDYLWRVNLNEECIILPNIGANIGEVYYIEPLSLPYEFNVLGPNAILLKTKDSTKFMFTLLQADDFQNKLYVSIASSGQPKFNKTELKSIKLLLPKPDEQEKIGQYFAHIDNLITLHQRKCDKLIQFKAAMLQKMFPQNGADKPEIRFKGFTDAWEQRKLGEVASNFEYGLNASAKEFDGKNKYIRITDIDDESRMFLSDDITSPDTDLTLADKFKLEAGDILFARTGASVGKTYLYREKDGLVYYAGFLIRAKINSENDAEFVFQNTLTDSYNSFIRITSQRSGQPGVNAQEYQGYNFYVPNLEEQKAIGTYFRNLDNLITLHQRKCDKYKSIKAGLIRKLFP